MINDYKRSSNDYFLQRVYKIEFIKEKKKVTKWYIGKGMECQKGDLNKEHSFKPIEHTL